MGLIMTYRLARPAINAPSSACRAAAGGGKWQVGLFARRGDRGPGRSRGRCGPAGWIVCSSGIVCCWGLHTTRTAHQRKRGLSSGGGRCCPGFSCGAVAWGFAAAGVGVAGWRLFAGIRRPVPRSGCCRLRTGGVAPVFPGVFPSLRSSSGLGRPRRVARAACPDSVQPGWREVPGDRGGLPRVRRGV